jgi:arylsulfatase
MRKLPALLLPLGLGLALAPAAPGAAGPARPRPNLVIVMADDMGWSDPGCFGGEIPTPQIDALARGGVSFTHFYNTSRCCPTRAALLTGVHPHQAGVGNMNQPQLPPGYSGNLHAHTPTIAEALRPAGYRSYLAGKWHVAQAIGAAGPKHTWPLQRGFDRFYGTIMGAGSYFDPGTLTRDHTAISPMADPEYPVPAGGYYYTDAISDHAARYVREHRRTQASAPFFLYVAYTAPHFPLHAREADIARQRGRYDAGYDAVRRARFDRQVALGLIPAGTPFAPAAAKWLADPVARAWQIRAMEIYAAQIEVMDTGIGRIVAALRETGQLENTVVMFLHDNGASAESMARPAVAGPPPGPRGPADVIEDWRPAYTRDGRPVRYRQDGPPGGDDTYMTYGAGWAQVSNTPWRDYKVRTYEGGIATPLVVHWPAGIAPAHRGQRVSEPGHVIDLMATALDLAGVAHPPTFAGRATVPPEGVSLRPAFAGQPLARREPIFFEHGGNRAVRAGDWKLVAAGPGGPWELYNLAADRTETRDRAAAEPARVRALARQWETWAARAQVLPWPWQPAYGEPAK